MTKEEIESFREKLDIHLKEKTTEIESNIALIIIGSLGFFLTINEKFIGLKESSLKWILLISIIALLISFFVFLYNKHIATKFDREIIDFLDDVMLPNDPKSNKRLLNMWSSMDKKLQKNRDVIYVSLAIGIILQMLFFIYNVLNLPSKRNTDDSSKIEIIIRDSTSARIKLVADSSSKK